MIACAKSSQFPPSSGFVKSSTTGVVAGVLLILYGTDISLLNFCYLLGYDVTTLI